MRSLLRRLNWGERLLAILVACYLGLWPFEAYSSFILGLRGVLQTIIYLAAGWLLLRLGFRVVRALARRFLWRIRHRMAVVYVFIGVIPLALAFLLFGFVLIFVFGPVGAFLVSNEVDKRSEALYATADSIAWQLRSAEPEDRIGIGQQFLEDARTRYPGLLVRFETPNEPVTVPPRFAMDSPPEALESYRGVVRRRGSYYLAAFAQYESGVPSMLLMVPLTEQYLLDWLPGLGVVRPTGGYSVLPPPRPDGDGPPPAGRSRGPRFRRRQDMPMEMMLPDPAHPLDWPISWEATTAVLDWRTGETSDDDVFELTTRSSAVVDLLMRNQSRTIAESARNAGYILWALFGFAVVISTVVAVSLTRTITAAINELYVGAQHVTAGDFSHRTPIRGHTQLTELARTFNSMTTSIERLVEDSRERQKLESELAIANEMQRQLFPDSPPKLPSVEVFGVCKPAKVVSGDFYDYMDLDDHRVAVAFGDVAGKGISSALVMASAHATIRTQLGALSAADDPHKAVTRIVRETNRQLFEGTAPELFTTLFFALYDSSNGLLTYVNAGHLPPFHIRGSQTESLEVTGLVLGAFPNLDYESRTIQLEQGDLIAAFTDGVTEPENEYGEEFGEERLQHAIGKESGRPVDQIIASVMAEAMAWNAGPGMYDDMTMLMMRRAS